MKYGYLRQDDDGHWYLLEPEAVKQFENLHEQICSETDWKKKEYLIDIFIDAFDKNRLSGGISNLKVLME